MFNHRNYMPILRWKRAEIVALRELGSAEKRRITPLIELVPNDFAPKKTNLPPDIAGILATKAEQIKSNWGNTPILVDLLHLDSNLRTARGTHVLKYLGQAMRERGLPLIPVTGLKRPASDQAAVAFLARKDGRGFCLRLHPEDLSISNLESELDAFLSSLKVEHADVHLVVDFQEKLGSAPEITGLLSNVPDVELWRTFTFASGAFPKNLTDFKVGQHLHPRSDWLLWRRLLGRQNLVRKPTFADYTIQHGRFLEPPPSPNISASIRYTAKENWVIMRGEGLRNKGGPGHAQYPANAQLLCERPEYCGRDFSYGDRYVYETYKKPQKPGTPETWLRAGVNHHITFTVRQIAGLFGDK